MSYRSSTGAFALATALVVTMSGARGADATATDGVVLIDQARALAGVTISQPGTYRLTSNLAVSGSVGIVIAADDVTLDLGGFTVSRQVGPRSIQEGGIVDNSVSHTNLTIRNGTIDGFPGSQVSLASSRFVSISHLRVVGAADGIVVGDNASIMDSSISYVGGAGIRAGMNSQITGNVISNNGADGIDAGDHSTISGNIVSSNGGKGISCSSWCTINGNMVRSNSNSGIYITGQGTINANTAKENRDSDIYCGVNCSIGANVAITAQNGDGIRANCPSMIRGNLTSSIVVTQPAQCAMSENIPDP
jgi:parallel beta-helix repeat protein